jgi:hypothetical protein
MSESPNANSAEPKLVRKSYQRPQLTIYGDVSVITKATQLKLKTEDAPGAMQVKSVQ